MPNQHVQPSRRSPPPPPSRRRCSRRTASRTTSTRRIEQALGRTPSLTELGIFSVMWSEHCCYKSCRVHLKRLPTKGTRLSGPGAVVQGPGENAGIIDVGDGWACAFKIESHNHPSYIEPYQGAATGVGGILRDIFTMGARPLAVMDSLRFGPLAARGQGQGEGVAAILPITDALLPTPIDYARNRHTMAGVVHGVGGYGNCFGVPNLGGETRFEACYSGNPLLNAFALGLVRTDEIFYAKADRRRQPGLLRRRQDGPRRHPRRDDGLRRVHRRLRAEAPQRPDGRSVPRKAAAGSLPRSDEDRRRPRHSGHGRGRPDLLHLRDGRARRTRRHHRARPGPAARDRHDQLRDHAVANRRSACCWSPHKGREQEVLAVFAKWGLDCAEVGIVTADDVMRVYHRGELRRRDPQQSPHRRRPGLPPARRHLEAAGSARIRPPGCSKS